MYLNPQFIKTLPPNVDGRDFVIGDLHGCYDEVEQLLSFVNFNTTFDRLFSTGDLIDRGPKSIECLSLLRKPWFYAILGNHEELALNKIKSLLKAQCFQRDAFVGTYRLVKFSPIYNDLSSKLNL